MFPRIQSLDARVRASETFPRIRDAEASMKQNEVEFFEKLKQKEIQKKRKKKEQKQTKQKLPKIRSESQQKQYFTSFVLNKDPTCSQYMPFDEVYFPKMFNKTNAKVAADTIDNLWILGFKDYATRKTEIKPLREKPQIKV